MAVLQRDHQVSAGVEASPQLLFPEARQRRRKRWLTTGAVVLATILLLLVLLTAMAGGGSRPTGPGAAGGPKPVPPAGSSRSSAADFSLRRVFCYAPAFTGVPSSTSIRGPFCSAQYALTAQNLDVQPSRPSTGKSGYSMASIGQEPVDASLPSTSPADDTASATVVLPGPPASGGARFVLGPAALVAKDVKSAGAVRSRGVWSVRLEMTPVGSANLDDLAQQQFHALVAVVVKGRVVESAVVQSTRSSFSTLGGQWTISGVSRTQAEAIAASL